MCRDQRTAPLCPGRETPALTRRHFLKRSHLGFGWLAFAGLANRWAAAETRQTARQFAPRAKRVIFLFMDGGVSHVDTFDPKPELVKRDAQPADWKPDVLSQGVSAQPEMAQEPMGVSATWQVRPVGERFVSAHRGRGG